MQSNQRDEHNEAATHRYDRRVIAAAPDLKPGDRHPGVIHAQEYLRRFGYLAPDAAPALGEMDEQTVRAVETFQRRLKLATPATLGTLDEATRGAMAMSRCALADLFGLAAVTIGPWDRRDLTFAFGPLSGQVASNVARDAVLRAFNTWAAAGAGLTFAEVLLSETPDIVIEWRPAADPDLSMVGGTLAHADFPPGFSVIATTPPLPLHFDDQEHTWVDGAVAGGFDIETIALHEIGHCLGLGHSIPQSIMRPTFSPNSALRTLHADDLDAIRSLYPPTAGS